MENFEPIRKEKRTEKNRDSKRSRQSKNRSQNLRAARAKKREMQGR